MHSILEAIRHGLVTLWLFIGIIQPAPSQPVQPPQPTIISATITEAPSSAQSVGGERAKAPSVHVANDGGEPFDSVAPPILVAPNTVGASLPLENPNRDMFISDAPAGTPVTPAIREHDDNILPDGSVRYCSTRYVGMCGCYGVCTPKP